MGLVALLIAKELFGRMIERELDRTADQQHPAVTAIGRVAVTLL
jgi:hypothetical protein